MGMDFYVNSGQFAISGGWVNDDPAGSHSNFRASDRYSLFSAGNYAFSATVTDSGQNGTAGKQSSLIV